MLVVLLMVVLQMFLVSFQMCRSQFANVINIYMCRGQFTHFVGLRCQHLSIQTLSQRLHVACCMYSGCDMQINLLIWNRSYCCCFLSGRFALCRKSTTTTETWDKNATILGWNINMFAKWHRWKFQCPLLFISGSSSASGSITCFGHSNVLMKLL